MPAFATSHQHSTRDSSRVIKQEKEIKGIQVGKEEVTLYSDDILYRENPKEFTKKLFKLINQFSEVSLKV